MRIQHPTVASVDATLATLRDELDVLEADPDPHVLNIQSNRYAQRFLELHKRELVERAARAAAAQPSATHGVDDWVSWAMQLPGMRRVSETHSSAAIAELPDKETRFSTLLGLLGSSGYVPYAGGPGAPAGLVPPLRSEFELQKYLDERASRAGRAEVQQWYAKRAAASKRFAATEAAYGTADREMCEYAAEYLAPQHNTTAFNLYRV
jgi:hypothetical protein